MTYFYQKTRRYKNGNRLTYEYILLSTELKLPIYRQCDYSYKYCLRTIVNKQRNIHIQYTVELQLNSSLCFPFSYNIVSHKGIEWECVLNCIFLWCSLFSVHIEHYKRMQFGCCMRFASAPIVTMNLRVVT